MSACAPDCTLLSTSSRWLNPPNSRPRTLAIAPLPPPSPHALTCTHAYTHAYTHACTHTPCDRSGRYHSGGGVRLGRSVPRAAARRCPATRCVPAQRGGAGYLGHRTPGPQRGEGEGCGGSRQSYPPQWTAVSHSTRLSTPSPPTPFSFSTHTHTRAHTHNTHTHTQAHTHTSIALHNEKYMCIHKPSHCSRHREAVITQALRPSLSTSHLHDAPVLASPPPCHSLAACTHGVGLTPPPPPPPPHEPASERGRPQPSAPSVQ